MYISAEASMASGRVEAGPPSLKTRSSPQSGEGFPPLTPPTAPARPFSKNLEPLGPPKNLILAATRATFPCLGPPKDPKDPHDQKLTGNLVISQNTRFSVNSWSQALLASQ